MSKKKRRYNRRKIKKKKQQISSSVCDRHHLCFIKGRWKSGSIYALRQYHYCIILLPKTTLHKYIHKNMTAVPVPSELAAKNALEQLRYLERFGAISDDDPIEKRLMLLAALFDCIAQPTADGFRQQLGIVHEFYHKPPP